MCNSTPPCASSPEPGALHHYHGYLFCRILNHQHSGAKLPWIIWLKRQTCVLNGHYVTTHSFLTELPVIMQASLDRHFSIRHHLPVTRWMEVGSGGQSLVDDPSIRKPGFDVSRSHWALLNCFQTNQGHCAYCQKKSGLAAIDMCPCGRCQMRSHIVNSCPQTKLEGELQRLHSADDVDTEWLKMYGL